jgi:hypothetical protein
LFSIWDWAGVQSFTGLGLENKVLLVLGWRTKFYWSWAGEQSFTGLGLENKVLLVLGWRTKF